MSRGNAVTPEIVNDVKAKKKQYPDMTYEDLAKLCGTSPASVGRILTGGYDRLVGGTANLEGLESLVSEKLDSIAGKVDELLSVSKMNNELLRVIALNVTSMNDPSFTKSKNISATFRQDVIGATFSKEKAGE